MTKHIKKYGGEALTQADALDLTSHSPEVRVVADLSRADHVAGDTYDCFVNPFTTAVIYDVEAALYHAIRLLKPGGVLLVNFWCVDFYIISRDRYGDRCTAVHVLVVYAHSSGKHAAQSGFEPGGLPVRGLQQPVDADGFFGEN